MMRRCGLCGTLFFPSLPYPTHPGPATIERHGQPLCGPCNDEYNRIYQRRQRETENLLVEFANANCWSIES